MASEEEVTGMNQTHQMRLEDLPYEATKKGLKTIEVRLNDERRREISRNDLIEFRRISDGELLPMRVCDVRRYKALSELIAKEDFVRTGGIYRDRGHWNDEICRYYSTEQQEQNGLVVFEIMNP